jgi:hypothetical protein
VQGAPEIGKRYPPSSGAPIAIESLNRSTTDEE